MRISPSLSLSSSFSGINVAIGTWLHGAPTALVAVLSLPSSVIATVWTVNQLAGGRRQKAIPGNWRHVFSVFATGSLSCRGGTKTVRIRHAKPSPVEPSQEDTTDDVIRRPIANICRVLQFGRHRSFNQQRRVLLIITRYTVYSISALSGLAVSALCN